MSHAYKVVATPDGRAWCLEVPEIGRVTMAVSVKEIDVMAKDLISIMTGESNPAITVEYALPEEATEAMRLKAEAERIEAESQAQQRKAVRKLHGDGMPFREIGTLLGISYQRAHQLANA